MSDGNVCSRSSRTSKSTRCCHFEYAARSAARAANRPLMSTRVGKSIARAVLAEVYEHAPSLHVIAAQRLLPRERQGTYPLAPSTGLLFGSVLIESVSPSMV